MAKPLLSLEISKVKKELTKKLQTEMQPHFFDHTMHDINDALTSILALCDMEEMEQVPKVKGHIQRVNELLSNLKAYQTSEVFNLNHLLKNTINLFSKNFKGRVYLSHSFFIKRAMSSVDRRVLEDILVGILIEMSPAPIEKEDFPCSINLGLCQWNKYAQISFTRKEYELHPDSSKRIKELCRALPQAPKVQLKNGHTEVEIIVPLHFDRDFSPQRDASMRPEKSVALELVRKGA